MQHRSSLDNQQATMSSQRAPDGVPRKLYKDTRKCVWCARGIYDGATLSQCKGCLADVYCVRPHSHPRFRQTNISYHQGKDCQKLHWPLHKIKCKNDSESLKELAKCPGDVREFAALRRWTHLHRPALMFLAAQELNIYEHPSKTADTALKLAVHLLPQETKEQSRFRIVFVMPVAIADFASAHDIRCAYETTHAIDI